MTDKEFEQAIETAIVISSYCREDILVACGNIMKMLGNVAAAIGKACNELRTQGYSDEEIIRLLTQPDEEENENNDKQQ